MQESSNDTGYDTKKYKINNITQGGVDFILVHQVSKLSHNKI